MGKKSQRSFKFTPFDLDDEVEFQFDAIAGEIKCHNYTNDYKLVFREKYDFSKLKNQKIHFFTGLRSENDEVKILEINNGAEKFDKKTKII